MRKISTFFLAFFLSALLFAEQLRLISFNMGGRNRTAREVAEMISESGADIAFIQEIWLSENNDKATRQILSVLRKNADWQVETTVHFILNNYKEITGETYKTGSNGQNNAIFYNKSKVSAKNLAEEVGFSNFGAETGNPAKNFLFDKNTCQIVKFTPNSESKNGANSEFIAINVHLPYTDKAHRARDVATLERLYARYKQKYGVIIAGDFNYYRRDLTKRNFDFVDGSESWYYDPNFGLLTTLSSKADTEIVFASDYDHFIYSPKIRVVEQMRRAFSESNAKTLAKIQFGKQEFTSSVTFRKEISDHVPIMIKIETEN